MLRRWKRRIAARYPNALAAYQAFRCARQLREIKHVRTPHGFQFGGNRQMESGAFELEETTFLRDALTRANVFIDVGANIGYFSCLAQSLGKRVLAVEPLLDNLDLLYANLLANGWTDVEVLPVALGERPGLAVLYGAETGASLINGWSGNSDVRRRPTALSTLDILIGSRFAGERMVIKIDVEGAELGVLRGSGAILVRQPSPVWLVEVCLTENFPSGRNPHFGEVFDVFYRHGYRARTVDELRVVTHLDVRRWVADGRRDFGYVNYVFDREKDA